jgi:5-methylcytosine-specific restriction endonuclease McrA
VLEEAPYLVESVMAKKSFVFVLRPAVISALRRLFRRWPPYKEVVDRCKEEHFIKSKHGKDMRRVRFSCEVCDAKVDRKQFAVDHIEPVIGLSGFVNYDIFVERLFCPVENLQGICKTCHDAKSKLENKQRRNLKKETR